MPHLVRLLLIAAVLTVAACAPKPDELYDRGQRLEVEGRLAEAFDHYVRALERAPDMRKAQGRARVVGNQLAERHLREAGVAATPPEVADAYREAASVSARARAVGLALDLPPSFEADRLDAYDAAVEALLADGAAALDAARFADALAAFARVARYDPSIEQAEAAETFAFDTHLAWAEADLQAGRFRSAFARAEEALPFASAARSDADVRAVQDAALAAGTVHVAVFPEEAEGGRRTSAMPPGFLETLQDYLEDAYWTRPPPFVGVADPGEVRRFLRRVRRTDGRYTDLRLTSDLTTEFGADLGVATLVRSFDRQIEETDRDSLTVPLRGGGQARIARVTERHTLRAEAAFVVVAAGTRRQLCGETLHAEASGRVRLGEYRGRVRDLVLDRGEHALFDRETQEEAERAVEDDLIEALAERLAGRVFACVERQVP